MKRHPRRGLTLLERMITDEHSAKAIVPIIKALGQVREEQNNHMGGVWVTADAYDKIEHKKIKGVQLWWHAPYHSDDDEELSDENKIA